MKCAPLYPIVNQEVDCTSCLQAPLFIFVWYLLCDLMSMSVSMLFIQRGIYGNHVCHNPHRGYLHVTHMIKSRFESKIPQITFNITRERGNTQKGGGEAGLGGGGDGG